MLSYSKIKFTTVSPIMPNLIKQELGSVYKYFSAKPPKFANTGNFCFKKSKLLIIYHHKLFFILIIFIIILNSIFLRK